MYLYMYINIYICVWGEYLEVLPPFTLEVLPKLQTLCSKPDTPNPVGERQEGGADPGAGFGFRF